MRRDNVIKSAETREITHIIPTLATSVAGVGILCVLVSLAVDNLPCFSTFYYIGLTHIKNFSFFAILTCVLFIHHFINNTKQRICNSIIS